MTSRSLLFALLGAAPAAAPAQGTDSIIRLDAIVVTAARREERLKDVVVQTELISRHEIERSGAADVGALLAARTGFQIDGGVPAGANVLLQGLGSQRVLILLDGKPLVGRVNGNFDLTRLPASMVERIEVVRGPQSTLYGSDAMGGVVNIITRRPLESGVAGRASAIGGTQARREFAAGASGTTGALGYAADAGVRWVDLAPGVPGDAGTYANRWHFTPTLEWHARPSLSLEGGGIVIGERQRYRTGQLFYFADNTQWSGRLGATWRATSGGRFAPLLYVSRFEHLSRASTGPSPVSDSGQRDVQQILQAEATYGGLVGSMLLDAGLEVRREELTSDRITGRHRVTNAGASYAQLTWARGPLRITPGARLSVSEQWGTAFTPRLAVLLRPIDRLALRAGIGRGFRAPDFKELYFNFVNTAVGYAVRGNPDLKPESSTNLSAGIEWAGSRVYTRASGFSNRFRNFIETGDPDVTGTYTYGNIAGGRTSGVDLEVGLALSSARLDAGYGFLATRDDRTGQPLLGRPTHSARAALETPLPLGARGSLATTYSSSTPIQRAPNGAVTAVRPAYTRVDLRLEHPLPAGLALSIGVDDVFNAQAGQNWPGFTGQQVFVGVRWSGPRSGGPASGEP